MTMATETVACDPLAAVLDLPFEHMQAVWLVDVCGYNYDQVAAARRCSRNDVATLIREGRYALRHCTPVPANKTTPKTKIAAR